MSYEEYVISKRLIESGPPFHSLIMAAMRKADSDNVLRLRAMWPGVWEELETRYNTPGGLIPKERREEEEEAQRE